MRATEPPHVAPGPKTYPTKRDTNASECRDLTFSFDMCKYFVIPVPHSVSRFKTVAVSPQGLFVPGAVEPNERGWCRVSTGVFFLDTHLVSLWRRQQQQQQQTNDIASSHWDIGASHHFSRIRQCLQNTRFVSVSFRVTSCLVRSPVNTPQNCSGEKRVFRCQKQFRVSL